MAATSFRRRLSTEISQRIFHSRNRDIFYLICVISPSSLVSSAQYERAEKSFLSVFIFDACLLHVLSQLRLRNGSAFELDMLDPRNARWLDVCNNGMTCTAVFSHNEFRIKDSMNMIDTDTKRVIFIH